MRVHIALAFENFNERLEPQIAARRCRVFVAARDALVVGVPGRFVIAGFGERAANGFFHAHARGGIARGSAGAEIGALGIFAQSELDARQRAFKGELGGGLTPTQLDDDGLTADGVGAAVQDIGGGHAAGEVAVDGNVVRVEHVGDVDDRGDRDAAFVDVTIHGDVRVTINDAGDDELSGGVDDLGIFRRFDACANVDNFPVPDQDGAVFDGAVGNGEDR